MCAPPGAFGGAQKVPSPAGTGREKVLLPCAELVVECVRISEVSAEEDGPFFFLPVVVVW